MTNKCNHLCRWEAHWFGTKFSKGISGPLHITHTTAHISCNGMPLAYVMTRGQTMWAASRAGTPALERACEMLMKEPLDPAVTMRTTLLVSCSEDCASLPASSRALFSTCSRERLAHRCLALRHHPSLAFTRWCICICVQQSQAPPSTCISPSSWALAELYVAG